MRRDPFEVRPWWEVAATFLVLGAAVALTIGLTALVLTGLQL